MSGWSVEGTALFILSLRHPTIGIFRFSLTSHTKALLSELTAPQATGLKQRQKTDLTPDGKTGVMTLTHEQADLFLVEALNP